MGRVTQKVYTAAWHTRNRTNGTSKKLNLEHLLGFKSWFPAVQSQCSTTKPLGADFTQCLNINFKINCVVVLSGQLCSG